MLVSAIIARVRNIAGDTDVLQFQDTDIMAWINDAMRECASDNQLLQKTATSNTIVNTNAYDIPVDILKLYSISYDGDDLTIITLDQAKERGFLDTAVGVSAYAWIWASKIKLYPAPDAIKALEVSYTRTPVDITLATETPELPVSYHQRLIDYCLAQVAQQDDDMNRYSMKMDEFRTGVANLKDQPEWENNQYPFMGISERDAGEYDQW